VAVSSAGGCSESVVSVGSPSLPSGVCVAWVRCPASAAAKLSVSGSLSIGWSTAIIEMLDVKRKQCYKCWQFGHVRGNCRFAKDRE